MATTRNFPSPAPNRCATSCWRREYPRHGSLPPRASVAPSRLPRMTPEPIGRRTAGSTSLSSDPRPVESLTARNAVGLSPGAAAGGFPLHRHPIYNCSNMSTGAYQPLDLDNGGHRQLLLSYDFPPMAGGIARLTGELAKRYPPSSLLISTGSFEGSAGVDARLSNQVDRLSIRSTRLRTIQGLVLWSRRAGQLARGFRPGFVWCGNLKPAGFPALWLSRREKIPYGIMLYGSELLLLQQRIRGDLLKRAAARWIFQRAAVLVAISEWTRRRCLEVLDGLGCKPAEIDVRRIPLGTDPVHFRPELDTSRVRARYGLEPGRWLITVARLVGHKGFDTGLRVLAALRDACPDLRYAIVGSG